MHSPKRTAAVPPSDEGGGAAACRRLAGRDNEARECQNITIRSEGNPVSYDGKTFSWNGKQLIKVTAADGSYTELSYDANGIRTQKRQYKADGEPEYYVNYVWQDGLLTHQSMTYYFHVTLNGTEKIVELPFTAKFVYDESNTPVGCLVNGEAALAFVRNLKGDVIAVVTQEGDVLAEYSYDPWGKVTVTCDGEEFEGMEAALMALYCPFAYRGYNYDYTTGLYYLQSRYYNPEWGRFLNVDDTNILLSTQGENLGANLFAYCNNNPVSKADYTGKLLESLTESYLQSFVDLVWIITNDHIVGRGPKNGFLKIEKEPDSKLYKVQITFVNPNNDKIYNTVKTCFIKSPALTGGIIAFYIGIYFQQKYLRAFLFSPECISREIQYHIAAYMTGIKRDRSNPIDISEKDVYKKQIYNFIFGYNSGIRKCYYYTYADPFLIKDRAPVYRRSQKNYVDPSNTEWEQWLTVYGR